ncbi:MAG: hypothetical protein KZQ96_02005 [Candidatus Thiodiazotropha sp. (ex Lucinoma borealis)]|nr:hypothetical protein [Candidatus Thiodiazotropha sp. (ex Lucinoma borealis)]
MGLFSDDSQLVAEAERIASFAREEIKSHPDIDFSKIESWLSSTLHLWKVEYGIPPPANFRTKLPDDDHFDDYAPHECAGHNVKNPIDLCWKLIGDEYRPLIDGENIGYHLIFLQLILMTEPSGSNIDSLSSARNFINSVKHSMETHIREHLFGELARIAPDAAYGQKMRNGPRQTRLDALGKEMKRGIKEFQRNFGTQPEAGQLLEWLESTIEDGSVIQEVNREEEYIYWRGRDKPTKFKSFHNRLTRLRKLIQKEIPD